MASKEFEAFFQPQKTPYDATVDVFSFLIKDSFKTHTLFTIGAAMQLILLAILPQKYALLPILLLLGWSVVKTVIQSLLGSQNDYIAGTVAGRSTAQYPDRSGSFGNSAASKQIVVFHFGVRYNHPLGIFAPGARTMNDYFQKCNGEVLRRRDELGCLGLNYYRGTERSSNNTAMIVYYFRDMESLNKFAHDRVHREAWNWIQKAGHRHISFFHEAFYAAPGTYETIYVNTHPMLMGATSVMVDAKAEDGAGGQEEKWANPLVSAEHPALRSQFARMGKEVRNNAAESAY